jgi:hypothetical protein
MLCDWISGFRAGPPTPLISPWFRSGNEVSVNASSPNDRAEDFPVPTPNYLKDSRIMDTWGLGAQSFFALFGVPRIKRAIIYK